MGGTIAPTIPVGRKQVQSLQVIRGHRTSTPLEKVRKRLTSKSNGTDVPFELRNAGLYAGCSSLVGVKMVPTKKSPVPERHYKPELSNMSLADSLK